MIQGTSGLRNPHEGFAGVAPRLRRPRTVQTSRIHAEENHRWTPMNTDSEDRNLVLLCLVLDHCSVNGLPPGKSAALSCPYLCLSVSICGGNELLWTRRPRAKKLTS